jgi:hypothetical protein
MGREGQGERVVMPWETIIKQDFKASLIPASVNDESKIFEVRNSPGIW